MRQDRELQDLRRRTKAFGLMIVDFYSAAPHTRKAEVMAYQLLRCGTSIGAHFREGCRARSDAELISKLETALQELDESCYWLELLHESGLVPFDRVKPVWTEADELIRIFVKCVLNLKGK